MSVSVSVRERVRVRVRVSGCTHHEICTSRFTKYCACHDMCTSRFTKRCACPHNLHFEVQKALCLPRSLQTSHMSKSHNSLHLSRNQSAPKITTMSKVLHLPRKLRGKVHKVLHLPRNLRVAVHKVLCLPRNLHFEVHKVLLMPRNLHLEVHKAAALQRNLQTSHMSKSHGSLHLSLSQSAPQRSPPCPKCCTCHEICTSKQSRSDPLHLSRKVDFGPRFPCTCHEK